MENGAFTMTREEQNSHIKIKARWGKNVLEILKAHKEVASESILGYSTIKQCLREFNNGRTVVSINHLCVRTLSVTNDEIFGNVAKLLEADSRRYTVKTVLGTTCIKRPLF